MNIYEKKDAMISAVYTTMVFNGIGENEASFKAKYFISNLDWKEWIDCAKAHDRGIVWFIIKNDKPDLFIMDCDTCLSRSNGFGCFDCGDSIKTSNYKRIK